MEALAAERPSPGFSQGIGAGQAKADRHPAEPAIPVTVDASGEPSVPPALGVAMARHVR